MSLDIQILKTVNARNTGTLVIKLAGSLDTATAPQLEAEITPALTSTSTELVFDLADLKFISSAGLRVFAAARKQLRQRGGQMNFVHLQPQIQEVFDIMQALPGMGIFKDVAELDRYLTARQRSHTDPE